MTSKEDKVKTLATTISSAIQNGISPQQAYVMLEESGVYTESELRDGFTWAVHLYGAEILKSSSQAPSNSTP